VIEHVLAPESVDRVVQGYDRGRPATDLRTPVTSQSG
jgi:hypothetical protein